MPTFKDDRYLPVNSLSTNMPPLSLQADEATVKQLALTDRSSALAARRGNKQIGLHNGPERSINVDSTAIRQSATSIK